MFHITTVDFKVEGKGVVNTSIEGEETLLDSDIVIVDPRGVSKILDDATASRSSSNLNSSAFKKYNNRLSVLRKEIETLLYQDKIVICYFSPVQKYFSTNNSGWQVSLSNYDFLPYTASGIVSDIQTGRGGVSGTLKLGKRRTVFDNIFLSMKKAFKYEAYLDRDIEVGDYPEENFILNKSGLPVGVISRQNSGVVLFLPQLQEKNDSQLISVVCQAAKGYYEKDMRTPAPDWVNSFSLPGEEELLTDLEKTRNQIQVLLNEEKEGLKRLEEVTSLKGLLYEKGKRLEDLVKRAFRLVGFEVTERNTGTEEHDIVFNSDEGKGIAEVEGKDSDWINVGKMDQLSRAVDEDFDITDNYATGVLVGNHFRLQKPAERKEAFTEKAFTVARRKRFALLNTVELFNVVKYILENPDDADFKKSVRQTILTSEGEEIQLLEKLDAKY